MKKKIRVLITGSKGFVGKSLKKYLKNKMELRVFCDDKSRFDLSKKKLFKKLLKNSKPNIIIHLASRTVSGSKTNKEDKYQLKNTLKPTKNLIECIKSINYVQKLIFAGTIEEYGKAKSPFKENTRAKPITSYGKFKLKCLNFVRKNLAKSKIKYIWLRPSLMFGPNDNKGRFLGSILYSAKEKKMTSINLDKQIRDYLFVEDFNRFIYLNLIKKNFPKIQLLNISNQNWVSLQLVMNLLSKMSKNKVKKYLIIKNKKDHSKLINSGNLLKQNYPNFKFTDFKLALKKTLKSYNI